MKENLINTTIFEEFFNDKNVYFPERPKLVDGISIYDAPNGLGLQFRGGPEKLIIRGNKASEIWKCLHSKLDGKNTFQELLKIGLENNLDIIDLCNFFKIVHSYHLLEQPNKLVNNVDLNNKRLIQYYDRLVGHSGFNSDGVEVLDKIGKAKILVLTTAELASLVCFNFRMAGFMNIGIFYFNSNSTIIDRNDLENGINIMTFEDITNLSSSEIRDKLFFKINDYHYILSVMSNPSDMYTKNITNFCFLNNKPLLTVSLNATTYEVGPLFSPSASACYNCYILRKQSYGKNNVYDFAYQQQLQSKGLNSDSDIAGFDITGFVIVINIAISELIRVISSFSKSSLTNKVFEMNTMNSNIKYNDVILVSGCPSCSTN